MGINIFAENYNLMEIGKDYNPMAHFQEMNERIKKNLGNPVDPPWEEVLKKWNGMCQYKQPRTFLFVFDIKQSRAILSDGMSLLGLPNNWRFTSEEFISLIHENQRKLLLYQTISLYELFFSHPELFKVKDAVYCTSRGISDKEGNYWLVHQVATPFQFDENGIIVRYLSSYRILGRYNGEALETEIYTDPTYKEEQNKLRSLMNEIKANMLNGLGFTKIEKWVIEMITLDMSSRGMASRMDTKLKTVFRHRGNINAKAKEIFPLNDFKNTEDVVKYLQLQNII